MRILFFWICAVSTDPEQHQLLYGEDHLDAHSPKADKRSTDVIRPAVMIGWITTGDIE
ncbi:hypothetical protein LVY71_02965 [Bradyrhizobium sp. G127]|nr:hypothetical protein [Bradyrhizobium sp. G127]